MKTLVRGFVTFLSGLAAMYFIYWTFGALMFGLGLSPWISVVVAWAVAIVVARYVWIRSASVDNGLAGSIMMGAFVTGAVGFCAGFFGPIIFTPGANQGPLLGIFITGPLGFLFGGIGGAVHWFVRGRHAVGGGYHRI